MRLPKQALANGLLVLAGIASAVMLMETIVRFSETSDDITAESLSRGKAIDLRALNYNNDAVERRKPAAVDWRVLSVGDSFAYTIVRSEYTYHALAGKTATGASGRTVEFVNLGEPAVSFNQYLKAYQAFGSAIEHDAVVFNIYLGNDLLDIAYRFVPVDTKINRLFGKLTVDLQTGETRRTGIPNKFPLRVLDYSYAAYLGATGKIQPVAKQSKSREYNFAVAELAEEAWLDHVNVQFDNFDPQKLPALKNGYRAAIRFAHAVNAIAASGKKVLVVLSPNQSQVDFGVRERVATQYKRDLTQLDFDLSARLLGGIFQEVAPAASVVYLRPALVCAAGKGAVSYYKTDTHWSAEGNSIVGTALGHWVAKHWLNVQTTPGGCTDLLDVPGLSDRAALFGEHIRPLLPAPMARR